MNATDPVQAVAEAMHADLCPDDECDGSDMGEWDRQAEVAVAAARPLIAAEALRDLHAEMSTWKGYDTRDIGWAFLASSVLEWIEDRADPHPHCTACGSITHTQEDE